MINDATPAQIIAKHAIFINFGSFRINLINNLRVNKAININAPNTPKRKTKKSKRLHCLETITE